MKIKFESKPDPKGPVSLSKYNFLVECKDELTVDFTITKPTIKQSLNFEKDRSMEKVEEPIPDGIFHLTKKDLKKLVAALQLIIKS